MQLCVQHLALLLCCVVSHGRKLSQFIYSISCGWTQEPSLVWGLRLDEPFPVYLLVTISACCSRAQIQGQSHHVLGDVHV